MDYGYIRVACASPELIVANCVYNADKIIDYVREAAQNGASLVVFPELSITSCSCGDLFFQQSLQNSAIFELERIAKKTANYEIIIEVGLPIAVENKLYNCAAILFKGKVVALVPKTNVSNFEKNDGRNFSSYNKNKNPDCVYISEKNPEVPFGTDILVCDAINKKLVLATELSDDLCNPIAPSVFATQAGATVVANLSATYEIIGKKEYRENLIKYHSSKNICAYLYSDASYFESSQDSVCASHCIISENGNILQESKLFETGIIYSDIDLDIIIQDRIKQKFENVCDVPCFEKSFRKVYVNLKRPNDFYKKNKLQRYISSSPFIPEKLDEQKERCSQVFEIQSVGLLKRLLHIKAKTAVIGLSGGLDSTLALLVTVNAFKKASLDVKNIYAITMPCFGTTDRTYNNACLLAKECGVTLKEINIAESVKLHFKDIGHDENVHDVTYENSQARERTQILMDYANKVNGIVIGTGDLSELALGWCTFNGDHMSMYGVNASVPKTLIRYIVKYYLETTENNNLSNVLQDILDTPVSPELLPPKDGVISQKTENLVGPYELHDFYMYYVLRYGFSPEKILLLADNSSLPYSHELKLHWLRNFYTRFFAQQFKRSCMPDGVKVGTVGLSPRGDWKMPSDSSCAVWLEQIDKLK